MNLSTRFAKLHETEEILEGKLSSKQVDSAMKKLEALFQLFKSADDKSFSNDKSRTEITSGIQSAISALRKI